MYKTDVPPLVPHPQPFLIEVFWDRVSLFVQAGLDLDFLHILSIWLGWQACAIMPKYSLRQSLTYTQASLKPWSSRPPPLK
jgi:hypothetical protein